MFFLKKVLKGRGVKVNYRDTKVSIVEAIISRGDGKLSGLFEFLFRKGVRLEAWREYFSSQIYEEWFEENGVDMRTYLGERRRGQTLPWSFIDTGIESSFFEEEFKKAESCQKTIDCHEGCAGCGLECSKTNDVLQSGSTEPKNTTLTIATPDQQSTIAGRWFPDTLTRLLPRETFTFRYKKYGDARYIGHIDTMNIILRALRASGIEINMHGKYHPMPKIVLSDALPIGIESTCELIEIEAAQGVSNRLGDCEEDKPEYA